MRAREEQELELEQQEIGAAAPVAMPESLESSARDRATTGALVTGGAAHELSNVRDAVGGTVALELPALDA